MAGCAVCGAKLGFFEGFLTARGKICGRCKEIDLLEQKLEKVLGAPDPLAGGRVLAANEALLGPAARLAALDETRKNLRLALAAYEIETGRRAPEDFALEAGIRAEVFAALFLEKKNPKFLDELLVMGDADRAAGLLDGIEIDASDAWLGLLDRLAAAGKKADALAKALAIRGPVGNPLHLLVAKLAGAADVGAVAAWLASARFVSPEGLADFLREVREGPGGEASFSALLPTAHKKAAGAAEEIRLLDAVGARKELTSLLSSLAELTSEILGAVEGLAKGGSRDLVLSFLRRLAAPGPLAARVADLAASLDASPNAGVTREILEKTESWARLLSFLESRKELTPEAVQAIRRGCRASLAREEVLSFAKIEKALSALLDRETRQGRNLLRSVAETGGSPAPAARLSARALTTLWAAADLEASLALAREIKVSSMRRKGRKGFSDEGAAAQAIPARRQAFLDSCERLAEADGLPFIAILWRGDLDREKLRRLREADDARPSRIEETVTRGAAAGVTEAGLLESASLRNFFDALLSVSGGAEAPAPARAVSRSVLYGLLAKRLFAPLDSQAPSPERTGPNEAFIAAAVRALAFLPRATGENAKRWKVLEEALADSLRYFGTESLGVVRQTEYWPSWLDLPRALPPDASFADLDFLPTLDGPRRAALEDLYRPPGAAARAAAPKTWEV